MRYFFLFMILIFNVGMTFLGIKNLSTRDEYETEIQKLNTRIKEQSTALEKGEKQVQEIRKKIEEINQVKEKMQEELKKKKKEAEDLAKELVSEKQKRKELEKKLLNAEKEVARLKVEVQREKEEKTKLQERLERMANRLEKSESDKGSLLSRLNTVMRERDTVKNKLDKMDAASPKFTLAEITVSEKKQYAGIILNVNEKYNFCIVSIGKNEGIVPGIELIVHRGSSLIGKIIIERVFDRMSSAKILSTSAQETIRVEDSVRKF
ncbi:MAG: hypothetical protein JW774_13075 [Candidatus Aureabacteria bacterium]|nr:hypothetical protein [Candidatus Auribacterota bacterium]